MSADCHHSGGAHPGLNGDSLGLELADAETRCQSTQERLTPPRRRVLELLLQSDTPLKAYDLIAAFGLKGESAKPPTVYRALEFLERMGFANRIESLNAYVACGHWKHGHAAVFLICDKCGMAGELHANDSVKKLTQEVESVNFKMRSAVIEIRGLCEACAG
jgi:Fur family zinc uptake transcriptional regulator